MHIPLLGSLIDLYSLVVLGAVILSWINLSPDHPIARVVYGLTEPVLRPIRERLPAMMGFDFSPMLLLMVLRLVRSMV